MADFGSSFQDASEHGERATRPARLRAEGASARSRRSFSGGGSAPTKRRARERVGEFEERSPSNKTRSCLIKLMLVPRRERALRASHATGARRRSGARESL